MMTDTRPISNGDELIDSRDVIARIEDLERTAIAVYEEQTGTDGEELPNDFDAPAYLDDDEADELRALRDLAEQGEDYAADWRWGAVLIRESYFEQYARELAEDIGSVPADYSWPASHIDWTAAADALRMDYSEITFDSTTYLVRS